MITSFLFMIFGLGLGMMLYPIVIVSQLAFEGIQVAIPIKELITWLFTPLLYFNGVFPIDTLVLATTILAVFYLFVYGSRFILWLISLLPFMHNLTLPFHTGNKE